MKILIAGAAGFIGSHIATALQARGHEVVAAARSWQGARKRLPSLAWIGCDFTRDDVASWTARLRGVDAVINCVGVLQNGLNESSRAVHVDGLDALLRACEQVGVGRFVHISAVGAEAASGSAYAADKEAGEQLVLAAALDTVVLRPSLVIARNTYGGSSLIRALAGLPWITPVVGGEQVFRPIMMEDVVDAVDAAIQPGAARGVRWDLSGPERVSLAEIITAYRRWLGFGETRLVKVPRWMARPAFLFGDLLGWLGIKTAMRTNSLKQLDFDVEGDPGPWLDATGAQPQAFSDFLNGSPAGAQDRWFARLGFARPLARVLLGAFWLITGILSLTIARSEALFILERGGFSPEMQQLVLWGGSIFDMMVGAAMLLKRHVRTAAWLMAAMTIAYLTAITISLPGLWAGALGPALKSVPLIGMALMIAATEDER